MRGVVGGDDSNEGARGGHKEGFHGDGEVADCGVAFLGEHYAAYACGETGECAQGTAFEDSAGVFVFVSALW